MRVTGRSVTARRLAAVWLVAASLLPDSRAWAGRAASPDLDAEFLRLDETEQSRVTTSIGQCWAIEVELDRILGGYPEGAEVPESVLETLPLQECEARKARGDEVGTFEPGDYCSPPYSIDGLGKGIPNCTLLARKYPKTYDAVLEAATAAQEAGSAEAPCLPGETDPLNAAATGAVDDALAAGEQAGCPLQYPPKWDCDGKEFACFVARTALNLSSVGGFYLATQAASWGASKVGMDLLGPMKSGGCLDSKKVDCATTVVEGILKDLWANIYGVGYLAVEAAKGGWGLAKSAAGSAYDTVAGWFGAGDTQEVEDKSSDAALASSAASDSVLAQFTKDPGGFLWSFAKALWRDLRGFVADNFGCEQWSGVAGASKCLKPFPGLACANCVQLANAACGVLGVAAGEIVTAYVTAGIGSAIFKGAKVALAGSKLARAGEAVVAAVGRGGSRIASGTRAGVASVRGSGTLGKYAVDATRLAGSGAALVGSGAWRLTKWAGSKTGGLVLKAGDKVTLGIPKLFLTAMEKAAITGSRHGAQVVESLTARFAAQRAAKAAAVAAKAAEAAKAGAAVRAVEMGDDGVLSVGGRALSEADGRLVYKSKDGPVDVARIEAKGARLDATGRKTATVEMDIRKADGTIETITRDIYPEELAVARLSAEDAAGLARVEAAASEGRLAVEQGRIAYPGSGTGASAVTAGAIDPRFAQYEYYDISNSRWLPAEIQSLEASGGGLKAKLVVHTPDGGTQWLTRDLHGNLSGTLRVRPKGGIASDVVAKSGPPPVPGNLAGRTVVSMTPEEAAARTASAAKPAAGAKPGAANPAGPTPPEPVQMSLFPDRPQSTALLAPDAPNPGLLETADSALIKADKGFAPEEAEFLFRPKVGESYPARVTPLAGEGKVGTAGKYRVVYLDKDGKLVARNVTASDFDAVFPRNTAAAPLIRGRAVTRARKSGLDVGTEGLVIRGTDEAFNPVGAEVYFRNAKDGQVYRGRVVSVRPPTSVRTRDLVRKSRKNQVSIEIEYVDRAGNTVRVQHVETGSVQTLLPIETGYPGKGLWANAGSAYRGAKTALWRGRLARPTAGTAAAGMLAYAGKSEDLDRAGSTARLDLKADAVSADFRRQVMELEAAQAAADEKAAMEAEKAARGAPLGAGRAPGVSGAGASDFDTAANDLDRALRAMPTTGEPSEAQVRDAQAAFGRLTDSARAYLEKNGIPYEVQTREGPNGEQWTALVLHADESADSALEKDILASQKACEEGKNGCRTILFDPISVLGNQGAGFQDGEIVILGFLGEELKLDAGTRL